MSCLTRRDLSGSRAAGTGPATDGDVPAEVSRGRSSGCTSREGPNRRGNAGTRISGAVVMQKRREPDLGNGEGRKPEPSTGSHQAGPARKEDPGAEELATMEAVVARENMLRAWRQVERNKGAAGVDGLEVKDALAHLRGHWEGIKASLLEGNYEPQNVRRVDIPKEGGGTRMLGVPTVTDRLIQQAVLQILTPVFDPDFSRSSYGFRPGRSAHEAVQAAKEHIRAGHDWVVDLDLSKFFDRVHHDILMSRVEKRVRDKRLLKLIRGWLTAGMMQDGVVQERGEGTPQGGPISPLLANIMLDDLDKRLEATGHRFCRYADDCNVYVRSKRAGERVMTWMRRYLEGKLRLLVNEEKSAVDRPENRKFLGFSFQRGRKVKVRVAGKSWVRFKEKVRNLTQRSRGCSLKAMISRLNVYLIGWRGYFRLAELPGEMEEADAWIRRRLRCFVLRQWKRPRTRACELHRLGAHEAWTMAGSSKGVWCLSKTKAAHSGLKNEFFTGLGLASLAEAHA